VFSWTPGEATASTQAGEVVIEEYFEGREVAVDGLLVNGEYQSFPIGDVSFFDLPARVIPVSICYPTTLPAGLQDAVRRATEGIVRELGLPFGLTHAEYRVREETGELCLLEVAARGGGMFISSDIVPLTCGIEAEEILLRLHLGEPVETPRPTLDRAAAFCCFAPPAGRLFEIVGLGEVRERPDVHRVICDLREGDVVAELTDKAARPVVIVLSAHPRQSLDEAVSAVSDKLRFVSERNGRHVPDRPR
ncbi:MAG: ATP-grasp domain-containing protein, partial [Planctomycetota bacterium]